MSDDAITDGKPNNEDKPSTSGKLESMSKEDLIKLVKNQVIFRKKLENKLNELTAAATTFNRTEEHFRNQIELEQAACAKLTSELEQSQLTQTKLQEELNLARQTADDFQTQSEKSHAACQQLQDELTSLQNELSILRCSLVDESHKSASQSELLLNLISTTNDLFQLPLSLPELIDNEFVRIYRNELEQKHDTFKQTCARLEQETSRLQEQLEDVEFFNEEVKLENDDLRSKVAKFQQDKQAHEQELGTYRRQIEDFEEQFLELQRESGMAKSDFAHEQADGTADQTIVQSVDHSLDRTDDNHSKISKASSTSSLLLSSDIPTLLHSVGITNGTDEDFTVPLDFESVLRLCTLLIERCRVLQYMLLKKNDVSMNSLLEHEYDSQCISFVQNAAVEQCRIIIHKQDHLALDTLFERIYTGMNQTINSNEWQIVIEKPLDQDASSPLRLEFDQFRFVSAEIEQDLVALRQQNAQLEKRPLANNDALGRLKDHQACLEKQLVEQCEKTKQLESILKQENLDRARLDQLKQIESSYHELQDKLHFAEQLEEQLKSLQEKLHEKDVQCKRQHSHLLERDEVIRAMQLEIDELERFKDTLIDKYQKEFEAQKLLVLQATQSHEQRASEAQTQQLEQDLKQTRASLSDKEKQCDDLQLCNEQLQTEKKQDQQDIQLLRDKIATFDRERLEMTEDIDRLKQQIQSSKLNFENALESSKPTVEQAAMQLRQSDEHSTPVSEGESGGPHGDQLQSDLQQVRQENEMLQHTINQLTIKYEKQISDPGENVQELKEKYQKMKMLLTRLKKELQDKAHAPKQSLIDLELADYEKTIESLKANLLDKDKEAQDLREELSASADRCACLKREILSLEQQKTQTDHRANKFKALLDSAKKELQNAKDLELQRFQSDDQTRERTDQLHRQLADDEVLISALSNENHQLIEKLNKQNETSQRTVTLLEQNLRITRHELDIAKRDYDTLQDDFSSYKIRAQSVLKQHQANQRERTPSQSTKQQELEATIEQIKANVQEANDRTATLITENESLQKEQTRLIEAHAKLLNESKKREQDLRKQHHADLENIESAYSQRISESQDAVRMVTLQTETLSTAYKEQLAALEANHELSRRALQDQLEACQRDMRDLRAHLAALQRAENDRQALLLDPVSTPSGINDRSASDRCLAWSEPECARREKSESMGNGASSADTAREPCENDPSCDTSSSRDAAGSTSTSPGDATSVTWDEFTQVKSRLLESSELLNESELNNARLSEQIAFLKDEIRRLERNMERAESISNLEYLKNIILKFFVLKSTPERVQLIPVLVTMLKLSPSEQEQLVRVANAPTIDDHDALNAHDASTPAMSNGGTTPSWSSYLNMW